MKLLATLECNGCGKLQSFDVDVPEPDSLEAPAMRQLLQVASTPMRQAAAAVGWTTRPLEAPEPGTYRRWSRHTGELTDDLELDPVPTACDDLCPKCSANLMTNG